MGAAGCCCFRLLAECLATHHTTPPRPLLCCRAYLDSFRGPRPLLPASFSEWVQERRELKFLLSQLDLS